MEQLVAVITDIGKFFNNLGDVVVNFLSIFKDIFGYLLGILGFIWYAGKTLILGVYKLFVYIINNGVFVSVQKAFLFISDYIGFQATVLLSALLFIAIVRIIIAFVFKIMRLNLDYNSLQRETTRNNLDVSRRRFNLFKH